MTQGFVVFLAFCYFACLFLAFFILYLIFESTRTCRCGEGVGPPGEGGGGGELEEAGGCSSAALLYPWEQIPPQKMIYYTSGRIQAVKHTGGILIRKALTPSSQHHNFAKMNGTNQQKRKPK